MAPIIKDSAKVDSASIISGLGYTPFNETGDTLTGTGGAGFYGAIPQSSSPSTPGSGFRLYANASHALSWVGQNGFTRTFDGTANTANRAYTLPNASGTIALTSDLSSYFPVAGGSLTGTGGAGFYGAIPQSSAPSTPASGFRLYANASGLLEWKGTNGFTRTFDGSANTADRAYTLPNSSGTIALEGTLTSLANPTIQNGFYQFVQNTKPTQRAAGVPLVAGDRWYKTDDGTEWFWNGTYWCGSIIEDVVPVGPRSSGALPDNTNSNFTLPVRRPFLLQNVKWRFGAVDGNHSVTNHWVFSFREAKGGGAANNTQLLSYNSTAFVENPVASINNHEVVLNLNTFFNLAETTVWDYIAYKVGAPHNIVGNSVTFTHRLVQL